MKGQLFYGILATLLLLSFALYACSGGESQTTDDEAKVRDCFSAYKSAILNKDGEEALKYVSASTIEYYGEMKDIAVAGSEDKVRGLSTGNKLVVLMLRHLVGPDLTEMNAEEVFVYAVAEGLISEDSVVDSSIGDINIWGDSATAVFLTDGEETLLKYEFVREDGQWRFDLKSLMPLADYALKQLIQASELDEDEFLFQILESLYGRKVPDEIWQPLVTD